MSPTGRSSQRAPRVYLAGPDVFFPNASDVLVRKREICAAAGLIGVAPLDNAPDLVERYSGPALARAIFTANERAMRSCDAILANIAPFRGVSADPGTVYEMGFMRGLGKLVFAYSTSADSYAARVAASAFAGADLDHDRNDCLVENWGLADNLMITGAIEQSGGSLVTPTAVDQGVAACDLGAFSEAVNLAARALGPD